jgi:P27 family predicted phage terminase small subunit
MAIAEWQRLAPMLQRARQLTEADRASLVALCLEWSVYLTETTKARREGRVLKSGNGMRRANPRRGLATTALSQCLRLWAELGLTPTSRSRVKTEESGPGPAGDAFTEFDDSVASGPDRAVN